jgi:tetratricopeptide (TPR) repeat protein
MLRRLQVNRFILLGLWMFFGGLNTLAQENNISDYIQSEQYHQEGLRKKLNLLKPGSFSQKLYSAYFNKLSENTPEFLKAMSGLVQTPNSTITDDETQHFYQILSAEYYLLKGDLNSAKQTILNSNKLSKTMGLKRWGSYSNRVLGSIYLGNKMPDSCQYYFKKAIELAKRSNNNVDLIWSLHGSARAYYDQSEVGPALSQELLAIVIAQKIKNEYLLSVINTSIAEIALESGNLRQAENFLRKSAQNNLTADDPLQLCRNTILQAKVWIKKNESDQAFKALKKVVSTLTSLGAYRSLGEAWMIYGKVYSVRKNIDSSLYAFQKALVYFENSVNPYEMAEVYHSIGLTYFNNKDLVNAEKNFLKSITIQGNIKDTKGLYENYNALAQLFSLKGNQKLAYLYLKKYTDYLKQNSLSVDSKIVDELTQSNSREERELLISSQEEELNRELREKEILQLQSDRQLLGIIVVAVIFILSAIIFFFVIRQRNVAQEQRETEMSQTLLRSQMNPHFIFNALAVIQSYIFENTPEKTSSFLVNFSKLIRLILENSPKEFITVDIEREILTKYLTTQKLRFEDRFNFELHIDEELIQKRALIPPMITQPFVENSIEHGQLHAISDGIIRIHMHELDGMLEIMVSDNGVGREKAAKIKRKSNHKSMALNITRERIQILNKKYKGKGNLEITDLDETTKTGTMVRICLPLIYENITFDGNEKNTNH